MRSCRVGGPRLLDLGERDRSGPYVERALAPPRRRSSGSSLMKSPAGDRADATADDLQPGRTQRGRRDGCRGPAIEPIWIQVSGALRSARAVSRSTMALGGGLAPDVVDDDVDVGRRGELVERAGLVGAEGGQCGEPCRVAAGGDHLRGAEQLGDLDRHPAGVAGGAEDQHALPGGEVDAAAQRDPGGHHRVHRGRDLDRVDRVRAARRCGRTSITVRSAIVPERRVVEHGVAQRPFGSRTTPSMPGTRGSSSVLRVVRAVGL